MTCVALGYWLTIFLMSIVMLSNLPGEKVPSLSSVMHRMVSACWPSYLVFLFLTFVGGSMLGPYVSKDPFGHKMTVPASFLGLLYMPYALALVAVRCPTMQQ